MFKKFKQWLLRSQLTLPVLIAREVAIVILVTAAFMLPYRRIEVDDHPPLGGFEVGVFSPADRYDDSGYEHDPTFDKAEKRATGGDLYRRQPTYYDNPPAPATGGDYYEPVDDPSLSSLPKKPCATTSGDPPACQKQEVPNPKNR